MRDEGDGLRQPPVSGSRGRQTQAPNGQRADAGTANAEGARMNGSPQDSAGAPGPGGSRGAYGPAAASVPPAQDPAAPGGVAPSGGVPAAEGDAAGGPPDGPATRVPGKKKK